MRNVDYSFYTDYFTSGMYEGTMLHMILKT